MGWVLVVLGGAALGGLATIDPGPSMPGWSLPLLGALFAAWMLVEDVFGR